MQISDVHNAYYAVADGAATAYAHDDKRVCKREIADGCVRTAGLSCRPQRP